MMRAAAVGCCAALLCVIAPRVGFAQKPLYESKPVTVTATIEAIDKASRVVTLRDPKGNTVEVTASDQVQGFDRLRVGDQVSATYFVAVALQLRKPGAPPSPSEPTTITTRKDREPGSVTRRDQTVTGTVASVDPAAPSITVKGPKGRALAMTVSDARQLQNLKVGDAVDVTYYESLMIEVTRR